ncbi:MAG: hypothetical protein QF864_09905 [SAR202 cluster bacterium]|jgi:hypothetical protein|nr:hypothetical protein [SAR202 cluster bacterium]
MTPRINKSWGGLRIGYYEGGDIYPLLPLLKQEFPDWSSKQINSYIGLVTSKKDAVTGLLVARNEADYYVGLIIYTIQQMSNKRVNRFKDNNRKNKTKKEECLNVLVVENLIASSPVLQKKIYIALVNSVIDIAKINSCDFVELPKLENESYDLIRNKYQKQITESKGFRTYLKISKSLIGHMEPLH